MSTFNPSDLDPISASIGFHGASKVIDIDVLEICREGPDPVFTLRDDIRTLLEVEGCESVGVTRWIIATAKPATMDQRIRDLMTNYDSRLIEIVVAGIGVFTAAFRGRQIDDQVKWITIGNLTYKPEVKE